MGGFGSSGFGGGRLNGGLAAGDPGDALQECFFTVIRIYYSEPTKSFLHGISGASRMKPRSRRLLHAWLEAG